MCPSSGRLAENSCISGHVVAEANLNDSPSCNFAPNDVVATTVKTRVQKKLTKSSVSIRSGGVAVAEQLAALGTRRIFTVPGETFISALDGLYDQPKIRTIVCRHEGGAAMMAEATAKLTGKPGVVFVTRAPGLANAVSGLVVSRHDQTPLVLLVGLPNSKLENRGDLQVAEFQSLMGALTKSTIIVRNSDHIPQALANAFHEAQSGRPGAVAVGFPEDCLNAPCATPIVQPHRKRPAGPKKKPMKTVAKLLRSAKKPLVIVGGGAWCKKTQTDVEDFAARFQLPVASAFRCQDFFDNRHQCYVGHAGIAIDPSLANGIRQADVLIVIGANLGDVTTGQYRLIKSPQPNQRLIHVRPKGDRTTATCRPDLKISASSRQFAKALRKLDVHNKTPRWSGWRRKLRKGYKSNVRPVATPGAVNLEQVVHTLAKTLPKSAIITNGAGNYAQFVHRYFVYKGFGTCLAPAAGSMGYGLPAAIAAKLAKPKRTVVAFAGDGCVMMCIQELATAVQYGANVITIVANNGMLGTIRMHQEIRFPDRVIATTLTNPNFAALAESFGAHGERVATTSDFPAAFQRAQASNKPAVIELLLDPEALTPEDSLSDIAANSR